MTQALRARPLLVALVVVLAIAAAVGVKANTHVPTGAATVQLMVDSPQSALADLKQDTLPLITRAQVFAQLMTSGAVLDAIAHSAGVPTRQVTAEGPYSGAGQALDVPTPSPARASQLVAVNSPYHFTFVADTNIPLVTASVQAPSPGGAARLANAVYPGVKSWLSQLEAAGTVPTGERVTVRQLGNAQAGSVNASSSTTIAGVAAAAVLLIGFLALIALDRRRGLASDGLVAAPPRHGDEQRRSAVVLPHRRSEGV
jgi:capsular polysaccharide biosynthesis protein